jgi:hypothetical protein
VGFGEVVVGVAGLELVGLVFMFAVVRAFRRHGASVARGLGRKRKRKRKRHCNAADRRALVGKS